MAPMPQNCRFDLSNKDVAARFCRLRSADAIAPRGRGSACGRAENPERRHPAHRPGQRLKHAAGYIPGIQTRGRKRAGIRPAIGPEQAIEQRQQPGEVAIVMLRQTRMMDAMKLR